MWERVTYIFTGIIAALLIPFVITMTMTGVIYEDFTPLSKIDSGKVITVTSVSGTVSLDIEQFLVQVLAAQISPDFEEEALKAQAVIARTMIKKAMAENSIVDGSSLSMEYLTADECKSLWGKRRYDKYMKRLENAVMSTYGQTLTYDGSYIDAMYHSVSMGNTISAQEAYGQNIPYLTELSCSQDVESQDYMEASMYSWEDMVGVCNTLFNEGLLPGISIEQVEVLPLAERIQVEQATEHGYVQTVSIGGISVSGDAFSQAANLQSHVYYIEVVDEQYRIVCLGKGHSMGLSQYTANSMAMEGADYQGILNYFYPGTVVGK